MIRSILAGLSSAFLVACSFSPSDDVLTTDTSWNENPSLTLIERVTDDGKDGDIVIPYSKYRLANGLTVIIHEDHSDPLVHVDVTYHVGSAREEAQRSGFA